MSELILKAENISKQYRLGLVGTGTLSHDLNRWWHTIRGKQDPYLKVGEINDRSKKASSDYVWALKDINFEVKKGEVLGIVGKNGAGKSTLLKILSKVTTPTTGEIKTKGRIASLLEVGTGFHPEMTGRENIYLNGAILGMTKREINSKLDEIIDFSGCERYMDTPVKRYSSGMTVRLAFAVAAHLEPDILVVDEVLAVGDAEFQKKAIGKMQEISTGAGRTVLFVSHNMGAIENLCNRLIVLKDGALAFSGDVLDGLSFYAKDSLGGYSFDLENTKRRKGTGEIKVKKICAYGPKEDRLPQTGKKLHINFEFFNPLKFKKSQIRLDFRIDDAYGNRLVWISTKLHPKLSDAICNSLTFSFDKLSLNEGSYNITIQLSDTKENVYDWLQNAASFEVISGNYYNQDQKVSKAQGKLLLDFDIE